MKTYIALIRGLGGQYTLPMTELVRILERMGMRNVRTHIQSGTPKVAQAAVRGAHGAAGDELRTVWCQPMLGG